MSTSAVGSTSALLKALSTAQAGDTIQLEAGVYSELSVKGLKLGEGVMITSRDPSAPAVLSGLKIQDSEGLRFSQLEFARDAGSNSAYPFKVVNSSSIHFDNINVHGSVNGDPTDDAEGITINDSRNVSVVNSHFHDLQNGLGIVGDTNVVVSSNRFHDIQNDGVRGGGTSYLEITGNTFTDFYPIAGNHPDAIQLWTRDTAGAAHDILISGNQISRGKGAAVQGVFLSDEMGTMPYERVTISNNLIVGSRYNGISINGGLDIDITHNTVVGYLDEKSWIRLQNVHNADIINNETQLFMYTAVTGLSEASNRLITAVTDAAAAIFDGWTKINPYALIVPTGMALSFSGTPGASDHVQGTANADVLRAAQDGPGWLEGGAGDDVIWGGVSSDIMRGDTGSDSMSGGGAFDDMNGNAGSDTLHGDGGNDWVVGGKDQDLLFGDEGDDIVYGNLGDDTCYGGDGADWVRGGQGEDMLFAGAGNDFISGDKGADTIWGGSGADLFYIFNGAGLDRLMDFSLAEGDRVQIDPNTIYTVEQVGGDAVIRLATGDTLWLVGVQAPSQTTSWIIAG